ncbi:hypothetical protein [Nocardiopsis metallicus]|uniref:Uncharacterized protein n=1 Tax=Nocardiopsis metallicus TaxID=179819 RepID=A0A840WN86_9ACTN|nr:hypothetical protein [Nocardiopsis metallicus]MBB5491588.1 hypothetical protein [Nocardiopsis metallicus]
MPRLSHTLDLAPVDRGDVARAVSAVHEVLRSARFDDTGELILPSEQESERLERQAEELGIVPAEAEREERERRNRARLADLPDPEQPAGAPDGDTERELWEQDRSDEAAVREATLTLRLLSGEHLAPGSTYLATEVDADGRPLFDEGGEGWLGTDLTVTAWEESGVCSVDFSMREDATSAEDGAPPVTIGSVVHDRAEETLTVRADMRFPMESAMARWGSSLLRARITARVELRGWFAAAAGGATAPPVTLEVEHRLVRAHGYVVPAPGPNGLWSVSGDLSVRGRGLARPLVAAVFWALVRSVRRAGSPSVAEHSAEFVRGWDDLARALPELPGFLGEVAESLATARPRNRG